MKGLIPIVLIIAAIGIFFGFVDPRYKEVKAKRAELAEYHAVEDRTKALLGKREALREKYKTFNSEDLSRLEKLLPNNVDNVRLIIDLDNIAKRHNVTIKNITFNNGADKSGIAGKNEEAALSFDEKPYGSLELSFSVTATYEVFMQLLSDLEDALRIVDVTALTLKPDNTERGTYTYGITLRTYWLR